jgi:hypothetical protein
MALRSCARQVFGAVVLVAGVGGSQVATAQSLGTFR